MKYIDKNNGLECFPTFISYTRWIQENNLPDNDDSINKYNQMIKDYIKEHYNTK